MQSASSRIWTRVAVSIAYDDDHYATGTGILLEFISIHHNSVTELIPIRDKNMWIDG